MNRRQFTTSLSALTGAAALPFPVAGVMAPAVPPSTYAWAQLIARAQVKVSPTMLARQLHLSPEVAHSLFNTLIRDGVLRAPSAVGIAQAARPLQATGYSATKRQAVLSRMEKLIQQATPTEPLAKDDDPALVCSNTAEKDNVDASTREHIQESPQSG